MRLLDRFGSRSIPEPGATWGSGGVVLSQTFGSDDTEQILPTFQAYSSQGYEGNGIVFAVMLARISLFSEATFKWRDLSSKRLFGTPALTILEQPWPGGTTGELLARMEQDVSLAGNAFICREGDRLTRWRPDWVDIVGGEDGDVVGYIYWHDGRVEGEGDFYPVEQVAHWTPIPDPLSRWRGMSWLSPVAREINSDLAMTAYKRDFFDNSATPNALITYKQKLAPGATEKLAAQWANRYAGSDGWQTGVLDQGADFRVIGSTMDQIKFTDVQAAGENRIAAAAGVPAIIVGLKEGMDAATYSNYGQAMRRFADITMRPNWRSACAALSKLVQVPDGARLWYDTTDIAALREGEKERADTMQVLSSAASTLLMAGYTADSITSALTAADLTLLQHTGLLSVQLQPPGTQLPTKGSTP